MVLSFLQALPGFRSMSVGSKPEVERSGSSSRRGRENSTSTHGGNTKGIASNSQTDVVIDEGYSQRDLRLAGGTARRPVMEIEEQETVWGEDNRVASMELTEARPVKECDGHQHDDRGSFHDSPPKRRSRSQAHPNVDELRERCRMLESEKEDLVKKANRAQRRLDKKTQELESEIEKMQYEYEKKTQELGRELKWKTEEGLKMDHYIRDLQAHLHQRQNELEVSKAEFRRAEIHHEQTRRQLDDVKDELHGAQVFLNQADSQSGADVIKLLSSLNTEILQGAAVMADSIEFLPLGENGAPESEQAAARRVRQFLGVDILQAILGQRPSEQDFDPTLIQLALQMSMVKSCCKIGNAWARHENETLCLKRIHAQILQTQNPIVAGRWRALARGHNPGVKDTRDWTSYTAGYLSDVLTVAGCPNAQEALTKFEERLTILTNLVLRVQSAVGEGITSTDLELFAHPSGEQFNPDVMEDTFDDRRVAQSSGEPILGTTELGLSHLVDGQVRVLVKAKVFFLSAIVE